MASKSILLLGISLLVVATKVSSYEEVLKIEVNYAKPTVTAPAAPVKPPSTPVPPVVIVPTPPPVKPPTPPLLTAPPPPLVKPPTTPPPPVKAPTPTTPPPPVKAPTPAPPVKIPPPQPPVVKPPVPPTPPTAPIVKSKKDCIPLCGYRCKLHSRKGLCMRACVTCCDRCKCVPPGTYGNREKCGKCYTDMLTHGNRPKCP